MCPLGLAGSSMALMANLEPTATTGDLLITGIRKGPLIPTLRKLGKQRRCFLFTDFHF